VRDRHVKYVKDVTHLADVEGKAVAGRALSLLKQLSAKSGGSVNKFLFLTKAARPMVVSEGVAKAKQSKVKAARLGAQFGKEKTK
jgi:hypothetical protein